MNDVANAVNRATEIANLNAAVEEAYDRIGKDMTAVKTEIAESSQKISGAVSALGVAAQEEARRGLGRARAEMGAFASDASGRASAAADAAAIVARDKATSIGGALADAIERRPVTSLSVAIGIGFLIGATLRR